MAAAIVPLIANLAPAIIDLIANLVHKSAPVAEQQLGAGTGPVKFAQVFSDVVDALTKAATAGQIDKSLPPDDTIKLIIQSVVSSMKIAGGLTSPSPAAATAPAAIVQPTNVPGTQAVSLSSGQSLVITVK